LVPTVLLKDGTKASRTSHDQGGSSSGGGIGQAAAAAAAEEEEPGNSGTDQQAAAASATVDRPPADTAAVSEAVEAADAAASAPDDSSSGGGAAGAGGGAVGDQASAVDVILSRLTSCVSRDLCDELAVNFCYRCSSHVNLLSTGSLSMCLYTFKHVPAIDGHDAVLVLGG